MKKLFRWKTLRWVALGIVALFVVIQLVPVDRSNPPVTSEIPAPPDVRTVLMRSCYDCHSNQTVWPWYSKVAPASWLVARDVHKGREELNFSTWDKYSPEKQARKLKETWEEVEEGEMPMKIYLPLHPEAALSSDDRELLRKWAIGAGGSD